MIYQGDCREILKELPAGSVNCCVTSPPYWGLRDYGNAEQLGLESTPEKYVANVVDVFREVWRVLRDDGTVWLNLGDSYAGSWGNSGNRPELDGKGGVQREKNAEYLRRGGWDKRRERPPSSYKLPNLKPKDLVGIPWRVAFALQQDGWYLRSDIIWAKPNPMPESVIDRPTKAHEYLFLLAKSERYYYDHEAIKEPCQSGPSDIKKMIEKRERIGGKHKHLVDPLSKASSATNIGQKRSVGEPGGRNKRTVWNVATAPYKGAHFATFPPDLIKPCILAGCPEEGVVLDPFSGAGTTGAVAKSLNREYVGIELNPEYIAMSEKLIQRTACQFSLF